jgi:hypothetical protein
MDRVEEDTATVVATNPYGLRSTTHHLSGVNTFPSWSVATRKLIVGHDTDLKSVNWTEDWDPVRTRCLCRQPREDCLWREQYVRAAHNNRSR